MTQAFTFIGTYRIRSDKLDQYRQVCRDLIELVETNEPRLVAFNIYLDTEQGRTSIVQVHPDASSMEFHLKVVAEHVAGAFDYLETESMQIFGAASDDLIETIRQFSEPGVPVTVLPAHEGGFTRTTVS